VVPFAYEGDVEDGKAKDPTISDFFSIQWIMPRRNEKRVL
jgi:hypothetical protein